MPEPQKKQITVTVTENDNQLTVELDANDLIDLRTDENINRVSITLEGEQIALMQRFHGTADLN